MKTYAIIKTKSNYRGLNGKKLRVVEEFPNLIACKFFSEGKIITADFGRSEVVKIWTPTDISNEPMFNRK